MKHYYTKASLFIFIAVIMTIWISGCSNSETKTPVENPISKNEPVSTVNNEVKNTKPPVPVQAKSKKLTVDEAIALACKKLDISNDKIKYIKTDPKSGNYEVTVSEYGTYFINPINGDFTDYFKYKIINLLGAKSENDQVEENTNKSIEDIVVENIKNNISFSSENVKFSAEKYVPFFTSTDNMSGGLILDNKYTKLSELGISEFINTNVSGSYYFADVDNDGTDELCCHGIRGTGLFPFTIFFKINKSTSKYTEWDAESLYNYNEDMHYFDIQFLKTDNKVYMVVFDDTQSRIFYIQGNKLEPKGVINITYPSYEVNTTSKDEVLLYLKNKYAEKITFFDETRPDESILKTSDNIYSQIESTSRDEFIDKSYTIADLDNDGQEEIFFKWTMYSSPKNNYTLYFNGYAIFKKDGDQYKLYDTNKDNLETAKYAILHETTAFDNTIFFEKYNGKTYTLVIDKDYSAKADFSERNIDVVTVYYIEKEKVSELGNIEDCS